MYDKVIKRNETKDGTKYLYQGTDENGEEVFVVRVTLGAGYMYDNSDWEVLQTLETAEEIYDDVFRFADLQEALDRRKLL